jgi:hypothetical protein
MRNGSDDGSENVYCGTYGRGGRRCWMGTAWKIREPRRPHIIDKAALTVIGNRAAQRNVTYKSAGRDERGKTSR